MASGLPTLVTGRGEIDRFVDESGGGVRAENDPQRIAERLDELLADDQLRRELARNGHEHVGENYDREEIAERLGDELASLVEGTS
jgi:glycosyltransferase involved in cell wall biosynthesis